MIARHPWRRARILALWLPPVLLLGWAAGFGWFLHRVIADAPSVPAHADGIVALTGGAERIETALHLLAEGRARRLLVSGVGRATEFHEMARRAGVDPALGVEVTLGRAAASTRGNAAETAEWARGHGVRTLIVVTAGYHMPRALAELSHSLPDVMLYPVPVWPSSLRDGPDLAALRLFAGEYTKWLVAELGLSALASRGEEHAAMRTTTQEHRGG
jgi:uncharacterized SAM-binding protein YcdF (DUF218 family)